MPIVLKSGSLNLLEPSGPVQACNGLALPFYSLSENGTRNLGRGAVTGIAFIIIIIYGGTEIFTALKFLKQCSLVVMINVGWKRCQAFGSEIDREMGSVVLGVCRGVR